MGDLGKPEKTLIDNWNGMCVKIKKTCESTNEQGGIIMAEDEIKVYSTPT
jgi:hypothetical protein